MTANIQYQPQDFDAYQNEIAQLRKEIADAKLKEGQPQGDMLSSQTTMGAGASGTKQKQGKPKYADLISKLDMFNNSLNQLKEQVTFLKSRDTTGEDYTQDRFGGEFYEGNGGQHYDQGQQHFDQGQQGGGQFDQSHIYSPPQQQQQAAQQFNQGQQQGQGIQQQQFSGQQGQQQYPQQQGGQFQGQSGQFQGQGQQGGQQGFQGQGFQQGFQQGGQGGNQQKRGGRRGGLVFPTTDQYQTAATGPGKAPVKPGMPAAGEGRPNRPRPLPVDKRRYLIENKPKTLKETFQAELVEEIAFINWKRKRLVLIGEDRLLERALSRINSHNIQCLPVVSVQGKGIIGTIDVLDIIQTLIQSFDRNADRSIQVALRRDFMNRKVSTLLSKNAYVISSAASLYTAVGCMIKLQQDRFVVVDRVVDGDVTQLTQPEMDVDGLFTLHDVVRFLVQNSILMREEQEFHRSLHELGLGQNAPKMVSHKTIAADAFKQIGRNCCMGLAVVDDNGCLIGNLSATDLKGVTRNNCPILNSEVSDFISRDQKRGWWERPITIDLNDSLYHTIHQFVSLGIHRMYVVDNQHRPIGEVSLRDVMNVVWRIIQ